MRSMKRSSPVLLFGRVRSSVGSVIAPVVALAALAALAGTASAAPRFFVVVRTVDEAPGVKSEMLADARKLFAEELGSRPELTLTPPVELSGDEAELKGDPEKYRAALRAHSLRAVELTLKILEVERVTEPPPSGKPFRVLKRSIRLSVFGSTLPDKIMAIGGDGDSSIAAEIHKNEDEAVEGKKLLAEATKIAIKQAVDMTVAKLTMPPQKDPKKKPAKKKK